MKSGFKRFVLSCLVALVLSGLSGCADPPQKRDLHGRWLHTTERQGLDFSEEGLLCRYSLAPQRIELFSYQMEGSALRLEPVRTSR